MADGQAGALTMREETTRQQAMYNPTYHGPLTELPAHQYPRPSGSQRQVHIIRPMYDVCGGGYKPKIGIAIILNLIGIGLLAFWFFNAGLGDIFDNEDSGAILFGFGVFFTLICNLILSFVGLHWVYCHL